MDYKLIHDKILLRAKDRIYDSKKYQKHHIIPICEDRRSTETIPLTIKEHYIIHLLIWKMGYHLGNYKGYLFTKGMSHIESKLIICSEAGKIGGKMTKDLNHVIFSPTWDRSKQNKINHELGLIDYTNFKTAGSNTGAKFVIEKKGIHNPEYQHLRHEWAMIGAEALEESGNRGGYCSKEWRENNKEKAFENSSNARKIGGKIVGPMPWWTNGEINRKTWESPGDEWMRGMSKKKGLNHKTKRK